MEDSSIARGRRRPKKTIGETIKRDLDFNGLNIKMICVISSDPCS